MPDPRVKSRQRTCGQPECRRSRHRKTDRAWHAQHPDYDRGRRLQKKLEQAAQKGAPKRPAEVPLSGLPWDVVQDEIGIQAVVIIQELAKVLVRHAQAERWTQVAVFKRESRRHGGHGAGAETARGSPLG